MPAQSLSARFMGCQVFGLRIHGRNAIFFAKLKNKNRDIVVLLSHTNRMIVANYNLVVTKIPLRTSRYVRTYQPTQTSRNFDTFVTWLPGFLSPKAANGPLARFAPREKKKCIRAWRGQIYTRESNDMYGPASRSARPH